MALCPNLASHTRRTVKELVGSCIQSYFSVVGRTSVKTVSTVHSRWRTGELPGYPASATSMQHQGRLCSAVTFLSVCRSYLLTSGTKWQWDWNGRVSWSCEHGTLGSWSSEDPVTPPPPPSNCNNEQTEKSLWETGFPGWICLCPVHIEVVNLWSLLSSWAEQLVFVWIICRTVQLRSSLGNGAGCAATEGRGWYFSKRNSLWWSNFSEQSLGEAKQEVNHLQTSWKSRSEGIAIYC